MRLLVGSLSFVLSVFLAGCASDTSPTPPPTPPAPLLKIVAPADGATVKGSPVTISVSATNVSDASVVSVFLDGGDITAKLSSADSNGVRNVMVQPPDINYGKNQIQIRYQDQRVGSSFIFDSGVGTASVAPANSTSLLVPIKTRVLRNSDPTKATNWGIQVGSNTYYSNVPTNGGGSPCQSGPCNQGFQILMLNRQDLSVVSNTSYEVDDAGGISTQGPLITALINATGYIAGCGQAGCIMVMQSLSQIGPAQCYGNTLNFCQNESQSSELVAYVLQELGMSDSVLWANGSSPAVAYSFIGNAGSGNMHATGGTQYERLGCSATRFQNPSNICDSLGPFNSSQNSAADPTQIGAISGVLIRDNYNSFTYAPNAPLMTYTFGTKIVNGVYTNVVSINGSTTEGNGQYTMTLPNGSRGGFRLLILNRNDPTGNGCRSCSAGGVQFDQFFDIDNGLINLINVINNGNTGLGGNSLVFLAGIGDLSRSDEDTKTSGTWDYFAYTLTKLGADMMTIKLLGDNHPAFNPPTNPKNPAAMDDYLLVGQPIPVLSPGYLSMPPFEGKESGYVILRHTVAHSSSPTSVEGVLVQDHEGYYTSRLQGAQQGLALPQTAAVVGASLLAPISWPFSSTTGQQNAYAYISNQLCCTDIRSTYINQNASADVWLTQLEQITYPSSQSSNFSQSDFDDVQGQLATEFGYVAQVRNLENNVLGLYQSQQSNVALILQQAADEVQSAIFTSTPPPVSPSAWSVFTTDVFPTLANLAGFVPAGGNAIKTALGVGTLVINSSVDRSNDANGNSQLMQSLAAQDIAASKLAQYAVDQYTDSLITVGNDFNRILSDWGRLKTLGGPMASGQLQWDSAASGYFLRAFNLTARRQYYPTLLKANSNFFVTHISFGDYQYYGSDSRNYYNNNFQCTQSDFHNGQDNGGFYNGGDFRGTAWYPGQLQSSNGDGANPGAYWWDIWALGLSPGTNDQCPDPLGGYGPLPSTFGMFDPIDQNSSTGLGLWKAHFLTHWNGTIYNHNNKYFGNVP